LSTVSWKPFRLGRILFSSVSLPNDIFSHGRNLELLHLFNKQFKEHSGLKWVQMEKYSGEQTYHFKTFFLQGIDSVTTTLNAQGRLL
jgi:hypothetical protein